MERVCSKCKTPQDLHTGFNRDSSRKYGLGFSYICKTCDAFKYKDFQKRTNYTKYKLHRLPKYHLSEAAFDALLSKQNYQCGICRKEFSETNIPCIDHDHHCCKGNKSCGNCIRGLLCRKCNAGIGLMEDNVVHLENAVKWVTKNETDQQEDIGWERE
jgi:hypothetical protein